MEALRETTGGQFHPHVYLLDGSTLIAYQRHDTKEVKYFTKGIKGFDKRGRQFEPVDAQMFKQKRKSNAITVTGSKGQVYHVDAEARTCTCPGFQFRGACKHLAEHG